MICYSRTSKLSEASTRTPFSVIKQSDAYIPITRLLANMECAYVAIKSRDTGCDTIIHSAETREVATCARSDVDAQ